MWRDSYIYYCIKKCLELSLLIHIDFTKQTLSIVLYTVSFLTHMKAAVLQIQESVFSFPVFYVHFLTEGIFLLIMLIF